MNKGLLALNGVLGIAVVILFYLQFSEKPTVNAVVANNTSTNEITNTEDSLTQFIALDSNISAKPIKIAYVDGDSLDGNLKMLVDVNDEIRNKEEEITNKIVAEKNRYENKYNSKRQNFESKMKSYSASLPSMTDAQAQAGERELQVMQQEIAGLNQVYSQELMMFQQKLEQDFRVFQGEKMTIYYGKVKEYCESIAKRLGFDFILMYQAGGSIIYSNKTYDISKYVIEAINKEYDANKSVAQGK